MARRPMRRLLAGSVGVALGALASPVSGQSLGTMLDSLHQAARSAPQSAWVRVLDSVTLVAGHAGLRDVSVCLLVDVSGCVPSLADVARERRTENRPPGELFVDLANAVRQIHVGLRRDLRDLNVPAARIDSTLTPTRQLEDLTQALAFERAQQRLNRYDIKYGPGAPPLNGVEVVVNYLLQGVPGFGPGEDGPGPLEFVASYSTTGATNTNAQLKGVRLISSSRFGVRVYDFGHTRSGKSILGALVPTDYSIGWSAIAGANAPLQSPLAKSLRGGVFVGLGALYGAYTRVGGNQVVVGLSQQLLPFTF
jgi:hypothetical protein